MGTIDLWNWFGYFALVVIALALLIMAVGDQ